MDDSYAGKMRMIKANVRAVLDALPPNVRVVAAAKTRTPQEIEAAVEAGIAMIGENYVKEAQAAVEVIGRRVQWHMIGHLQRNKVRQAVDLFDMIETVDSLRLAKEIEKCCARIGKVMPVLIEVNSGREPQKTGVLPEEIENLLRGTADLEHLNIKGLMTMGPTFGDPEAARPYFRATRELFDALSVLRLSNVNLSILSMGMSNSYRVAVEEGANLIRLGTKIFGERSGQSLDYGAV